MFQSLPLAIRPRVQATEARLDAIYKAASMGLKGDSLALASGMLPLEYRQLCQFDPLAELAAQIGVDAAGLEAAAAKVNADAAAGKDKQFGKGETQIDIEIGDPKHSPNACFGPLGDGPYYAIEIFPGDGSTTVGVKIDDQCRVIGKDGAPIAGLYAAGLDANSIWQGKSPAHGCNVGPAMVTGYIAGKAISGN